VLKVPTFMSKIVFLAYLEIYANVWFAGLPSDVIYLNSLPRKGKQNNNGQSQIIFRVLAVKNDATSNLKQTQLMSACKLQGTNSSQTYPHILYHKETFYVKNVVFDDRKDEMMALRWKIFNLGEVKFRLCNAILHYSLWSLEQEGKLSQ
jgi:hypothetical protein